MLIRVNVHSLQFTFYYVCTTIKTKAVLYNSNPNKSRQRKFQAFLIKINQFYNTPTRVLV